MARVGKEKKEKTYKKIVENATKMFLEDGYDETSTKKIAKIVGIAEGTVFNYFKTKADILLEVINLEFLGVDANKKFDIDTSGDVIDLYLNEYDKYMKKLFFIPKKIMIQLFVILMNTSKSNPERLKRLASIDFVIIDEIAELTDILIDNNRMKMVDSKELSETIYGSMTLEYMMYLYNKDYLKEDLRENIKNKIIIIINGYLIKR